MEVIFGHISTLSLPDRCPLDVPQLSTLPEMCFPSTYFTYKKEFYKEKKRSGLHFLMVTVVTQLRQRHLVKYAEISVKMPFFSGVLPNLDGIKYVDQLFVIIIHLQTQHLCFFKLTRF